MRNPGIPPFLIAEARPGARAHRENSLAPANGTGATFCCWAMQLSYTLPGFLVSAVSRTTKVPLVRQVRTRYLLQGNSPPQASSYKEIYRFAIIQPVVLRYSPHHRSQAEQRKPWIGAAGEMRFVIAIDLPRIGHSRLLPRCWHHPF